MLCQHSGLSTAEASRISLWVLFLLCYHREWDSLDNGEAVSLIQVPNYASALRMTSGYSTASLSHVWCARHGEHCPGAGEEAHGPHPHTLSRWKALFTALLGVKSLGKQGPLVRSSIRWSVLPCPHLQGSFCMEITPSVPPRVCGACPSGLGAVPTSAHVRESSDGELTVLLPIWDPYRSPGRSTCSTRSYTVLA